MKILKTPDSEFGSLIVSDEVIKSSRQIRGPADYNGKLITFTKGQLTLDISEGIGSASFK